MIPYGRQTVDQEDIAAVLATLESDWLTQGPKVAEFESRLADVCQSGHSVACNSGTAALHMAMASLGIGPDSIVVVPANTFLATANAAAYLGATVRFCDVDPVTGLMTVDSLAAVVDEDTSLVVPVHFAGQACDMRAIADVVRSRAPDAEIIEDASHAIGAVYEDGSPVGCSKWSAMTTFSFHPVKHVAAGEGGAVVLSNPKYLDALVRFRCHGMTKDPAHLSRIDEGPWYYEMHELGFNYRIPEISCALACSQLRKLDAFVRRRREIATRYIDSWQNISNLTLPPREHLATSSWHLFCLHIDFDSIQMSRKDLIASLASRGVGSQVHYFPVCLQPYYQKRSEIDRDSFSGAIRHYETELSVPMYPGMSNADVDQVIEVVADVISSTTSEQRSAA